MSDVEDWPRRPREPIGVKAFAGAVRVAHAVWFRNTEVRTVNSWKLRNKIVLIMM